MYTEPGWQKALKWLGILLAIGGGVAYYVITNRPAIPTSPAMTSAPPTSVAVSTVTILESPTTGPASLISRSRVKVGDLAPDFSLPTLDKSDLVSLSQFNGQPVVINFWASWCLPCRDETPALERAYEANQAAGLVILGVNTTAQDTLSDAQAFVDEFKVTYPDVLDEDDTVAQRYTVIGLPMSVFVNRQGRVQRIFIGGMTEDTIQQYIAEILAS